MPRTRPEVNFDALLKKVPFVIYDKEFSELLLEIPDMGEKDSLFSFMDGLAGWAKMEL